MRSPALEKIAQMAAARSGSRPYGTPDRLDEVRARFDGLGKLIPLAPDTVVTEVAVGSVACEWIAPPDVDARGAIVWLHGGWYALGSRSSHRPMLSRLAAVTRTRVLSVDYARAPEHPHPQALLDALAVWRWVQASGIEGAVLGGDSAGGGLTVATMLALRDGGEPMPARGVCMSPLVDLAATGDSLHDDITRDPNARRDDLLHYAQLYLAGRDAREPSVSPLYGELRGLPPLLVQAAAGELLVSDSTRLAERARAAGVDVTLELVPDVFHGWQLFAGMAPESDVALARIGAFIR